MLALCANRISIPEKDVSKHSGAKGKKEEDENKKRKRKEKE
jgi:hypothetical protein